MELLDKIGLSTRRLALCIGLSVVITTGGAVLRIHGYDLGTVSSFAGGALLALAIASWQTNAVGRARSAALARFWRPLSTNTVIVLPTRKPDDAVDGDEWSWFTPYQDAVAGHEVQAFIEREYGTAVRVVASEDVDGLASLAGSNVISIGGPNLNCVTAELMQRTWERFGGRYLHWSSTLVANAATRVAVVDAEDHLLAVGVGDDGSVTVADRIVDVHDDEGVVAARGLCLRLRGLLARGRTVLVLGGVDTAYGTLAAAQYVLDAENLLPLAASDGLQIVVEARPNRAGVEPPQSLRVLTDPL